MFTNPTGSPRSKRQRVEKYAPVPEPKRAPRTLPLPNELTLEIMRHLPNRQLLAPVSRDWRAMGRSGGLWRPRIAARGWLLPVPELPSHNIDWPAHYRAQRLLHEPTHKVCYVDGSARAAWFPRTLPELQVTTLPRNLATFVQEYGFLRHLRVKKADDMQISLEAAVPLLGTLQHLESLSVSGMASQPPQVIAALAAQLPALRRLTLKHMDVSSLDLAPLGALTQLEHLDLRHGGFSVLPPEFANLVNLKSLFLRHKDGEAWPRALLQQIVTWFPALEVLRLQGAPFVFDDLRLLGALTLRELSLRSSGDLATLPAELCKPTLRVLDVAFNANFVLPQELARLTGLEELDAAECGVGALPEAFNMLRALRKLDLAWCQNGLVFPKLDQLVNLRELSLNNCELGVFSENLTYLPALERLSLRGNELRRLPKRFAELRQLTHLNLDDNKLKTLPRSVQKLDQLRWLHLPEIPGRNLPCLAPLFPRLVALAIGPSDAERIIMNCDFQRCVADSKRLAFVARRFPQTPPSATSAGGAAWPRLTRAAEFWKRPTGVQFVTYPEFSALQQAV